MKDLTLYNGDCLRYLKEIPDKSVDFVLCDPPYGTTSCKWDFSLPMRIVWAELIRVTKPKSAIALFGSEPFSSRLRLSFIKGYKYDWIWNKKKASNFMVGNSRPMSVVEKISIFTGYKVKENYYPQKIKNPNGINERHRRKYGEQTKNSQDTVQGNRIPKAGKNYEPDKLLPIDILNFSKPTKPVHPTQKPVPLLEYLIKTYTLEGQTVLDFTMGSGSTGVAALNTKRKFIGIELEKEYFEIARERINSAINNS